MTTLSALKSEIADDIERTDLGSQVANAISRAITKYQKRRFWFNEARIEFDTVAGQQSYTSSDDADIGTILSIDNIFIVVGGQNRTMDYASPERWEYLSDDSASTGDPYLWTWFGDAIRLYPKPDQASTVKIQAHVVKAEPASDGEADNVWMTQAYQLIRAAAKRFLAVHITRDTEEINLMAAAENEALDDLHARGSRLLGSGRITPTRF